MFIAIMKVEAGRVAKMQDPFDTLEEAQAHVDTHAANYPNAFALARPVGNAGEWLIAADNTITVSPVAPTAAQMKAERTAQLDDTQWEVSRLLEQAAISGVPVPADHRLLVWRQELRDLPAQAGFPGTTRWPVKP